MKISDNGLRLISESEGIVLRAYKDPAVGWDLPTIGVGTTIYPNGTKVKQGDTITKEQAFEYLRHDTDKFAQGIDKLVTVSLNQNQIDALISFTYNVGLGNLKSSTLLKKINSKASCNEIQAEFRKWSRANGLVLKGLQIRREKEARLYCTV